LDDQRFRLARATISVTTPDGAVVSTAYSGNEVLVTDQAGKQRLSQTNALGQLTDVWEIRAAEAGVTESVSFPGHSEVTAGYHTSYLYDVLGNLIKVTQGSQLRFYAYDSLSRLVRAQNPEQSVNNNLPAFTEPLTGHSQWSVSYAYDDNGNLSQRIDARGVVSTYLYDSLNRNTRVTYTNDPANTPAVTRVYDGATNGKGKIWKTSTEGDKKSLTTIDGYDAFGRATSQSQQFYTNGVWSAPFSVSASYDKAGHVLTQTYPSGHTINYSYDNAGRLNSFSGNLEGTLRTYANDFQYTALGGLQQEKFGTDTPLYHKQRFTERAQVWDMRLSTVSFASDPANGDRGAIVNYYNNNFVQGGSNQYNNGSLLRQEIYVPANGFFQDNFDYDALSRLTSISEKTNGTGSDTFKQAYTYDRWGNRSIDQANTAGAGINKKEFTVDAATNRLGVPAGQSGTMTYNAVGNLTTDTYSASAVTREYDAENRLTSETQSGSNVVGSYIYNAEGQRVRRTVGGQTAVTTWQIYGMSGELLAEYAPSASATVPQKEYGYRNGQLLVTAEAPTGPTKVALAANGGVATVSSTYGSGYGAAALNNGDRKGLFTGADGNWNDAAPANSFPDWAEITFSGPQTISEIDVGTLQDNWQAPVEPTDAMTFSLYGLSGYDVEYWTGSAWVAVTGGNVTGNNKVWRKFSFAPVTTSKIRVVSHASVSGYTNLTEIEAWTSASPAPRYDLALAANGATASASSSYTPGNYGPSGVINGDRKGLNAGNNGNWNDAALANSFPDSLQIDFPSSKTIGEVDVFTLQDNWGSPVEPTEQTTFTQYGLTGYDVQYWDGTNWVTVPGGAVTGNNKVWRKLTFAAITTSKIRVLTHASPDGYSRITEVEAYAPLASSVNANITWLVTDQLGTPRMLVDKTGSLGAVSRHDYLPFGEDLSVGRSATPGYTVSDSARQKFTGQERDSESGLDYMHARYFSSTQGRFSSADSFAGSTASPQSLNRYAYVMNNPLTFSDPTGNVPSTSYSGPSSILDPNDPNAILGAAGALPEHYENARSELKAFGDALKAARERETDQHFLEGLWELGGGPQESAQAGDQESQLITGPYAVPNVAANASDYLGKTKTKQCATWLQQIFEENGKPLGPARKWYAGEQVNSSTKPGTAIMSDPDENGNYKNNPHFNHAGIFLYLIPGGFKMLENIRGDVQIRALTGTGDYFRGPDHYFVIMVPATVRAGIGGARRP
jgi:RHS repeat-associated protein